MVRAAAGARHHGRGGRGAVARPLRGHPGVAADQQSGGEPSAGDLRCADRLARQPRRQRAPLPDRVGQTYAITYDPKQRWYWFPRMRPDEALVFKVYESLRDGRARWTAHTAFADPHAPPHAQPRESIEIRTLAFF